MGRFRVGVGIAIGIEPRRLSIPTPTPRERLDGVSPHRGVKLESENLGLRRIRPRMGGRDD